MQKFKAISFIDGNVGRSKVVSLAFTESEKALYNSVEKFSSAEIRRLINIYSYEDLCTKAKADKRNISQYIKVMLDNSLNNKTISISPSDVTFKNSKSIPFHRWYPYIEGYSPEFVKNLIKRYITQECIIYDPFAGTGTTIFAADSMGFRTYYSEINPLLQFLINTKTNSLKLDIDDRKNLAKQLESASLELIQFKSCESSFLDVNYKNVFKSSKYFPKDNYTKILKSRSYIDTLENTLLKDLLTLSVLSSLIEVSYLKKQGDLRFRTEKELSKGITNFEDALNANIRIIIEDLISFPNLSIHQNHKCVTLNAKDIDKCSCEKIGCVITSPPYLNGTNYIRNTKLELWFLGKLKSENDLRVLRDEILTSGINDVKLTRQIDNSIIEKSEILASTLQALKDTAYDDRIPYMAVSYFSEMYEVFDNLKDKLDIGAEILIDIGDSIFNGVHVRTDEILVEIFETLDYKYLSSEVLRERRSRNGTVISQKLIRMKYLPKYWIPQWNTFKEHLPHQKLPYSKKNWGNDNHSLCSYQGKLKPAIAYQLVNTFVPEGGSMFDPFSGVGTIPFEAALNGKHSFGMDISIMAYYISQAKTGITNQSESENYILKLKNYIDTQTLTSDELSKNSQFGLNKSLSEYYEKNTFKEILLARRFFKEQPPKSPSEMVVISSMLHILHGNRPYALSRRSHPITPYAPTGEFEYRNLIEKLSNKVAKFYLQELPVDFVPGTMFLQDSTQIWPSEIADLDAIITSPPFFDSTRFYNANWIRLWFCGWEQNDFKVNPKSYIDERQQQSFDVYESIFSQSKERLKTGGVLVFHLGKSKKCDMGTVLKRMSKRWFNNSDLFYENVEHCDTFGLKDIGTVTNHEYLVLY